MDRRYFPIVFEPDSDGSFYGWVVGLPGVYGLGPTIAEARADLLEAVQLLINMRFDRGEDPAWVSPAAGPLASVEVLRLDQGPRRPRATVVGLEALRPKRQTAARTAAARANGRKGGRPRRTPGATIQALADATTAEGLKHVRRRRQAAQEGK